MLRGSWKAPCSFRTCSPAMNRGGARNPQSAIRNPQSGGSWGTGTRPGRVQPAGQLFPGQLTLGRGDERFELAEELTGATESDEGMQPLPLHGRLHETGAAWPRGEVEGQQQGPSRGDGPGRHRPAALHRQGQERKQAGQSAQDAVPDPACGRPVEADQLNVTEEKAPVGLLKAPTGNLEQVVGGQVKRHVIERGAPASRQAAIDLRRAGHASIRTSRSLAHGPGSASEVGEEQNPTGDLDDAQRDGDVSAQTRSWHQAGRAEKRENGAEQREWSRDHDGQQGEGERSAVPKHPLRFQRGDLAFGLAALETSRTKMPLVELDVTQGAQEPAAGVASHDRFFLRVEEATRKSLLENGLGRPGDGSRLEPRGKNFDLHSAVTGGAVRRFGGVAGRARQRSPAGWARYQCGIHLALYFGNSRQR